VIILKTLDNVLIYLNYSVQYFKNKYAFVLTEKNVGTAVNKAVYTELILKVVSFLWECHRIRSSSWFKNWSPYDITLVSVNKKHLKKHLIAFTFNWRIKYE